MYQEKVFIDLTKDNEFDVSIRLEEMEDRMHHMDATIVAVEEYLLARFVR